MQHIQTMAIKITEKTYPVAFAVLPVGFTLIPARNTFGCYLVINDLGIGRLIDGEDQATILENKWMPADVFAAEYAFTGPELKTQFTEVRRIA